MKTVLQRALERVLILVVTILTVVVAPELINGGTFDWNLIAEGSKVALGYWLLATFKDYKDPNVPNSNEPQG
jgi:hypothetical protein